MEVSLARLQRKLITRTRSSPVAFVYEKER